MNWKFWKRGVQQPKEFVPTYSERMAAYHWSIRVLMLLALFVVVGGAIWTIVTISFIGIDNTQLTRESADAEKHSIYVFVGLATLSSMLIGMVAKTKGMVFLRLMILAFTIPSATIEGLSVFKGRSSNIALQDGVRAQAQAKIDTVDEKIKKSREAMEMHKSRASPVEKVSVKKSGWQAIEAARIDVGREQEASRAATAYQAEKQKLDKLLEERSNLKQPPATESSILGGDLAQYMRMVGSALLIYGLFLGSRLIGAVMSSFSVHKSNKFVKENSKEVALHRYEPPIIVSSPVAKAPPPQPPKPPVRPAVPDSTPPKAPIPPAGSVSGELAAVLSAATISATPAGAFAGTNDDATSAAPTHKTVATQIEPVAVSANMQNTHESESVAPSSTFLEVGSTPVAVESATENESVAPSSSLQESGSSSVAVQNVNDLFVSTNVTGKTLDELEAALKGGEPMTIPFIMSFMGCDPDTAKAHRKEMRARGVSDKVDIAVVREAIQSKKSVPQSTV